MKTHRSEYTEGPAGVTDSKGLTAAEMERDEVEWRKAGNGDNSAESVRRDAAFIAEQTGADADKVFGALVKRFKPHDEDGDSITRRDEPLGDDDLDGLLAMLSGEGDIG